MHTIKVTDYNGADTISDVVIIGPYPTAADAQYEIDRFYRLLGHNGQFQFAVSTISPDAADYKASPETFAKPFGSRKRDEIEDQFFQRLYAEYQS